jgi:hypothetical protein
VGGTAAENGDVPYLAAAAAPSLARRVRPVLGYQRIVGKSPEGSRQIGHQALNLCEPFLPRSRESAVVCLSRSFAVSLSRPVLPCRGCSWMVS